MIQSLQNDLQAAKQRELQFQQQTSQGVDQKKVIMAQQQQQQLLGNPCIPHCLPCLLVLLALFLMAVCNICHAIEKHIIGLLIKKQVLSQGFSKVLDSTSLKNYHI